MKPFEIENFLDKNSVSSLYNYLIRSENWSLNHTSEIDQGGPTFPGMLICNYMDGQQYCSDNFLMGYFTGILENLSKTYADKGGFPLPKNILRIRLGAKNFGTETAFHTDVNDPNCISLLGFIMPSWAHEWGGVIQIEDQKFTCDPGKFIVFPSYKYHNGFGPSQQTPYWRISVNIICG